MGNNIYGILAEFDTPTQMVDAARQVRDAGYTKTDAFSPFFACLDQPADVRGIQEPVLGNEMAPAPHSLRRSGTSLRCWDLV